MTDSRLAVGLGRDPAYDSPGDLRSILFTLKLIGLCLVLLVASAAIPVPVPGLWGGLFLLLWVAVIAGGLWGGWRAGSAVLILLIATLFDLPLILGEGGARYVVWQVGARVLAAAAAAWVAGWLLQRRSLGSSLIANAASMLIATGLATALAFWLQRGAQLSSLPVTILGLLAMALPAAWIYRLLTSSRLVRGGAVIRRGTGSS